jgi:hypothetical protein
VPSSSLRFAFIGAAGNGHLAVAKWLFRRGSVRWSAEMKTEAVIEALRRAVSNCHVAVCRWLCGFLKIFGVSILDALDAIAIDCAFSSAAIKADFAMLEWLRAADVSIGVVEAVRGTAVYGELEVLQWLSGEKPRATEGGDHADTADTSPIWVITPEECMDISEDLCSFETMPRYWRVQKWLIGKGTTSSLA